MQEERHPHSEPPVALLRRLQWTVLRPLASALGGSERSLLLGPGAELDEVREYQPGDDVRRIDWNITARTDMPFVRQSRVERALDVWLLLDMSPSMDWGTARCRKRERALELAAAAGQILGQHGNRVGAMLFADRPLRVLPPVGGRNQLLRLLAAADAARPAANGSPTDLAGALLKAGALIGRKSLLLLVSDFLAPAGWQSALRRLAHRHEIVAARICDPRESELPDVGLITLEDPETGAQLVVDTANRRLRERFNQAAAEQTARIRADLASCGVDQFTLSTDNELLPALLRFLHSRRLRRARG